MPTNKLGLPTLTGNETADIPRDFNALAEKIDEKAGSPDGLAQLDGSGKTPITQLPDASTIKKGVTKLNDTTNSTSTTEAATANAVRKVNDALVTHSAETTQDAHVIANIKGLATALQNAEKNAKAYTDTASEAMLKNMGRFSTKRSSKNANGTFLKVERKRKDGTLFMKAEFSNPNTDGNPTVRTITTYAADGTTVVGTPVIYDVIYDEDGDYVEEVPR